MKRNQVELEYITWKKLFLALVEIANSIKNKKYEPDMAMGIVKGGLIPARILADLLAIDEVGFIGVKFYKGIGAREAKPELTLPPTPSVSDKKVLVIDDVVETGRTIQLVLDELYRYGVGEAKTATIYVKKWSPILPDYYYGVTDKWIVFPWELVETSLNNIDLEEIIPEEEKELYRILKEKKFFHLTS